MDGKVIGEKMIVVSWISGGVSCIFVKILNLVCVEIFSNSIYVIFFVVELIVVNIVLLVLLGFGVSDIVDSTFVLEVLGLFINFWDGRLEFLLKILNIY